MGVVVGWDVGGVNTKAAALSIAAGKVVGEAVRSTYFEVWHDRRALVEVLRTIAAQLPPGDVWAATMTAELSDAFETKREGVAFVVDALVEAAGSRKVVVFAVDGGFLTPAEARREPLRVAAANWAATARVVAVAERQAVLVDIGSTTADIIPLVDGIAAARGLTDPERLLTGELVYTGAVRTPVSAVVQMVPLWGGWCRVSSEYFAVVADVHLLLGNIGPEDYLCDTPDRREKTPAAAAGRLARVVCADTEMLSAAEIQAIAAYVADRQVDQIAGAIRQVISGRFPGGGAGRTPPPTPPPRGEGRGGRIQISRMGHERTVLDGGGSNSLSPWESAGVRALSQAEPGCDRGRAAATPHPNPLPEGEGIELFADRDGSANWPPPSLAGEGGAPLFSPPPMGEGPGEGFAPPVVAAGLGAFLARAAARRVGLPIVDLAATIGNAGSAVAPSVAVGRLWAKEAGWL